MNYWIRIPRKVLAALLALALVLTFLHAVPEARAEEGYAVDALRLEGGTDWGLPNPFLCQSRGPGTAKMKLAYASLLEKDEQGDVPWLAESWRVQGDTYTFTLYEGTTFHDSMPLTAADVAFTIDYYRLHAPVAGTLGAGEGFIVADCEVIDERTVAIRVKEPLADTLSDLGAFVILPKHVWEGVEDPYAYTGEGYLTGSGAYRLTGYDGASGAYEFSAFPEFKGGRPAAARVLFVPVSDPLLAFERGEIDIAALPADLYDRYSSDPAIGLVDKANDFGYKLLINFTACPQLLDRSLRAAMYAALDREAVVEKVFRGAGSVGSAGYVPEGGIYYNDQCERYPYEPEAARAALAGEDLRLTLLTADGGSDVAIAELLRLDLEAAGVRVSVVSYDSATRDAMVNAGQYELALVGNGGWGNNPPTYMRTVFSDLAKNSGGNPHTMGPIGYANAEITRLAEAQRGEVDFEARKELFKALQALVSREIPLLVIANQSAYSMYRKDHYDGWMKTYAYQQAEQNRLSFMDR